MDARYAESLVNGVHTVLGRRLHDYCLYDAFFLAVAENPIHTKQRDIGLDDLMEAVLICSSPADVLLRSRLPIGRRRLMLWKTGIKYALRWKLTTLEMEVLKFGRYIADFDSRPKFWEDENAGDGSLRAPWILSVAAFIEDHSNKTEREIMTAPMGQMLWRSAALAEQLGLTRSQIMTDEEEAAMKEMGIDV